MALFVPFRALGYIADDVPFAVQRRGKEIFITVSVGKSWQIYNASTLRLALVGPQLPQTIVGLASHRDRTFAATCHSILECIRVHRSGEYHRTKEILPGKSIVVQLLVLGDFLISLWRDGTLVIWHIGEYDSPVREIQFDQTFIPTCMAHPDTYVNKILIGSEDGRMQLWNFNTTTCLYEFSSFGSAIRCIVSSPALDVVGVGLSDGRVILHNVKFDKTLMQFSNAAGAGSNLDLFITGSAAQLARKARSGACTALAFRTGNGPPLMAVGGNAGVVTVWDLDKQRLHCTVRDAHDAKIVSLHFFAGEPVLLSSGADNSLKEWIFDGPDGSSRLLRYRSGHAAPPTIVRHYGDGKCLLSGGQDRAFRCFSTIQDAQSRELSQKHTKRRAKRHRIEEIELKLHRITALDSCDVRERDWSNVLTAHEDDTSAYVWRLQRYAIGEHVLTPPPKELQLIGGKSLRPVTAVCISHCGNFGFVGSASGRLDKYNMQSGLHRGAYYRALNNSTVEQPKDKRLLLAHDGAIFGIGVDECNRYLVSAGLDKKIRVWGFVKRTMKGEIAVGSVVNRVAHHPGTGLLAAACDDLVLRMYDVEALRLVRQFKGHTDRITDLQLSKDCKWLFSTSMDNTLRVWDVPGKVYILVVKAII